MENFRELIIKQALTYLGTPWKHQGRTKKALDCLGFLLIVGKDLGVLPEDLYKKNYNRRIINYDLLSNFKELFKQKNNNTIEKGDIVLFKDDLYPCHTGIYYGDNKVIHSCAKHRKTLIQNIDTICNGFVSYVFVFPENKVDII